MKFFIYIFSLFFILGELNSIAPACPEHTEEIKHIRGVAWESIVEAHKLTGAGVRTYVVSVQDIVWDIVKYSSNYSDFSITFQEFIQDSNQSGKLLASNRLYKGFNDVGDLFLDLYNHCILNHHNYRSVFERGKIHFDRGNVEACLIDMTDLIEADKADDLIKEIKPADVLITKAQSFLEVGEYEKAIEALTDVIRNDPQNKEAYFHRAAAYFESGKHEKALKDYLISDKDKEALKSTFVATKEFTSALLSSVCQGAAEAAVDFVPSFCSSAYGLGEAFWAINPLNPDSVEHTNQFASACYEMTEYMVEYCRSVDWDTLEEYVTQLKTLYERFDQLNDSEKGELIGYTVGKYGVDLFAGSAIVKSVSTYRKLRAANRVCNLESMAISNANKETIVASSLKHASERQAFFKNVKYNYDSHNKHILGHNDYDGVRSIWNHKDPEGLLRRYAGTGRIERGQPGMPGYKETVDFGEQIGIWKNKEGTIELATTRGTIHYGKKGAHIVPSNPNPLNRKIK